MSYNRLLSGWKIENMTLLHATQPECMYYKFAALNLEEKLLTDNHHHHHRHHCLLCQHELEVAEMTTCWFRLSGFIIALHRLLTLKLPYHHHHHHRNCCIDGVIAIKSNRGYTVELG